MRAATVVFLLFAAGAGTVHAYDEAALLKGRTAAAALAETLAARMARSVKESGPAAAMAVCVYQARALADEVAARQRVEVRRTALRLRNPANAPDDFEQGVLARFVADAREGTLPEELLDERRVSGRKVYRYAKPLVAGPLCITCHGRAEKIPEDVRKVLETRYPDDAATGYREGDFMGIVSVVIPAAD
ncbi:MAG: DUF3365 domain-containing protein [Gemmatimonadota bacterium]